MKKIINRNYFSLEELIGFTSPILPDYCYTGKVTTKAVKSLIQAYMPTIADTEPIASAESDELWCKFIAPQYLEEIAYYSEEDHVTDRDATRWFRKYIYIFNSTYAYYKNLIDIYNNELSDLMEDVKIVGTSRFNDTPQNTGDFSGEAYTTTFNETTNTSSGGTKMARIAEIQEGLRNLYYDWSRNFGSLFMEVYDE